MSEPSPDIVAELDRWLDEWDAGIDPQISMLLCEIRFHLVQRARDEIVELRKYWNGKGRAEVLEEAALACDAAVKSKG
jgi:hypothetical protein